MSLVHIKALDLAKQDKWEQSHDLIQDGSDSLSCLIHGYLHRVEGDIGNAKYWYKRANTQMPDNTLPAELERLYQLAHKTNN
ncbi:hypothetical protein [Catenovulum adriaticum]|uniref:Tetratricopeptide repeat protein n=1 Tax=Catenovulum adriaticum TaxID=2984846 RepID=A0ABY7ANH7_9ALTE|nr:hypothetical protein [Catenovulum sp. TS8]WAJ71064.1 hypothetical protein OLW01_04465 [Catenovulum sp. TS8]